MWSSCPSSRISSRSWALSLCVSLYRLVVLRRLCFSSRVVVLSVRLVVFFSWRSSCGSGALLARHAVSSMGCSHCHRSYRYRPPRHHRAGRFVMFAAAGCSARLVERGVSSWRLAVFLVLLCDPRERGALASVRVSRGGMVWCRVWAEVRFSSAWWAVSIPSRWRGDG